MPAAVLPVGLVAAGTGDRRGIFRPAADGLALGGRLGLLLLWLPALLAAAAWACGADGAEAVPAVLASMVASISRAMSSSFCVPSPSSSSTQRWPALRARRACCELMGGRLSGSCTTTPASTVMVAAAGVEAIIVMSAAVAGAGDAGCGLCTMRTAAEDDLPGSRYFGVCNGC